ncbi:hypothetical protein PTKIN_Ptkin07bG0061200 [Pterospermum kingtungense]
MATNSQQFGARMDHTPKKVNEVSISNLERQVSDLTSLVRQMAAKNMQIMKACGIRSSSEHYTDLCPTLQKDDTFQQENVAGNFPGPPPCKYDPDSNSYNPGSKDHTHLSYGNQGRQGHFQPSR